MPLTRPKITQLDSGITQFDDPLVELNAALTGGNVNDIGIIMNRGATGDNVGILWDRSELKFVLVQTTADGDSSGDITFTDYADLSLKTLSLEDNQYMANSKSLFWRNGGDTDYLEVLKIDVNNDLKINQPNSVQITPTLKVNNITSLTGSTITLNTNSTDIVYTAGKLGIGASPSYKLDVHGTDGIVGRFERDGGTAATQGQLTIAISELAGGTGDVILQSNASRKIALRSDAGNHELTLAEDGNVGFGVSTPTAKVDVNSDVIRVRTAKTPASATDTGNAGDICWDTNYVYICVATNTWKRSLLSTWA